MNPISVLSDIHTSGRAILSVVLIFCIASPAVGFVILALDSLFRKKISESFIAKVSRYAAGLQLAASFGVVAALVDRGFHPFHLFSIPGVPLFLDWTAAVYMALVGFIGWIVVSYSERYMHRESGYRRFFICLMIFLFGISLIILGGALDTLFIGWEIVGLASFLLVGFYVERPKAARHALRTFLTYRLCDVGLLIGAILAHALYHSGMFEVIDGRSIGSVATDGVTPMMLLALSFLIFLAAAGKGAQFPFSGWLPRAMEGPTASSAVFYGSLSIHCGVYLLLRTEAIWGQSMSARYMLFAWGALSALLAQITASVQPTVKGHIAWSSTAQVGLMFCELALGWHVLAVIHMVLHALLRCYHLLSSPSAVAQHFREGIHFRSYPFAAGGRRKWSSALYLAAMNEFYVDLFFGRYVISRFRFFSSALVQKLGQIRKRIWLLIPMAAISVVGVAGEVNGAGLAGMPAVALTAIAIVIPFVSLRVIQRTSFLGLVSVGFAFIIAALFSSRLPAFNSILRPVFGSASIIVPTIILFLLGDETRSVGWRMNAGFQGLGLLLVSAFWMCGEGQSYNCLSTLAGTGSGIILLNLALVFMESRKRPVANSRFLGFAASFPRASVLFLLGSLAVVTFPFTSAFRGEDQVLEAAFEISHVATVLGGTIAILIQLLIINAMSQAYFGAPRHEVRYPQLDLSDRSFALVLFPAVAALGSTLYFF